MSHALVLVATEKFPTDEIIYNTMLPYHEYESTGIEEYVIDIDVTEECVKEFEEYKEENKDELNVYNSLEEYATDYNGYIYKEDNNGKVTIYHHTNTNAKWDWYEIGGRYDNYLTCINGDFNVLKKKDIDFELKRNKVKNKILKDISNLEDIIDGREVPNFDKLVEEYGIEKAKDLYYSNKVIQSIPCEYHFLSDKIENILNDKESYINKQLEYVGVSYAIINDGIWYERGLLGMFAVSLNEKEDWNTEFFNIWNNIPDDYWITVIDYHI